MTEYERIIADMRADLARRTAKAARTLRQRCGHCWTPLHHSGYCAPGGYPVILTRCPRCDSYQEGDER